MAVTFILHDTYTGENQWRVGTIIRNNWTLYMINFLRLWTLFSSHQELFSHVIQNSIGRCVYHDNMTWQTNIECRIPNEKHRKTNDLMHSQNNIYKYITSIYNSLQTLFTTIRGITIIESTWTHRFAPIKKHMVTYSSVIRACQMTGWMNEWRKKMLKNSHQRLRWIHKANWIQIRRCKSTIECGMRYSQFDVRNREFRAEHKVKRAGESYT